MNRIPHAERDAYLARMVPAYLECAEWADKEDGDKARDFSAEAQARAQDECAVFWWRAAPWLDDWTPEQAGHDLWLTRNGHGAGFWDRGRGVYGDILTTIAKSFAELSLYVGDDGLYYFG